MCTHTHIHTYMYILDALLSVFGDMVNQQKQILGSKPEAWWSN